MSVTIRVLVADDHAVVREGVRHVLTSEAGFEVVAEAGSRADVIELARTHQPDVVVLDISMPDGTGLSAIGELRAAAPNVRVLILSIHDHEQYVLESVRAGAQGYLRKDSSPAELRDAVRAVYRGESFFSTAVAGRLASGLRQEASRQERADRLAVLSAREREVLIGVASGQTNKEIAAALDISPRTVESHRESLMRKLDIRSVAGLTKLAVEEGLLAG